MLKKLTVLLSCLVISCTACNNLHAIEIRGFSNKKSQFSITDFRKTLSALLSLLNDPATLKESSQTNKLRRFLRNRPFLEYLENYEESKPKVVSACQKIIMKAKGEQYIDLRQNVLCKLFCKIASFKQQTKWFNDLIKNNDISLTEQKIYQEKLKQIKTKIIWGKKEYKRTQQDITNTLQKISRTQKALSKQPLNTAPKKMRKRQRYHTKIINLRAKLAELQRILASLKAKLS